jgi:hypothetical protein
MPCPDDGDDHGFSGAIAPMNSDGDQGRWENSISPFSSIGPEVLMSFLMDGWMEHGSWMSALSM